MGKGGSFERMKTFRNICRRQEERGMRRRLVGVLLLFEHGLQHRVASTQIHVSEKQSKRNMDDCA